MSAKLHEVIVNDISIPVLFEQDKRLPLVSMQLVFKSSGALADSKPGLAKLASRLLSEGTKEMGSEAFAEALESRAIILQASVGAETFVISLNALTSEFHFGLEMLLKLLQDPNYSAEAFEKVQTQMVGMLTQKQSDLDYVADQLLKSVLFEGTAKAYPSSGTPESVRQITLEDLQIHIRKYLGKDNLIVVLGGDMEVSEAKEIASAVGRVLPVLSVPPLDVLGMILKPKTVRKQVVTEQAYLYFGAPYHMPYDSAETYLGKVASFVLGSSGFGSRLMEEIRVKRGLAYSAYSSFSVNHTGSYFTGHLQTKLESAEEAQVVVSEVVEQFISKGITQAELDAAKQFLIGSEPLRNETLQQRIGNAFHAYYNGKPLDYRRKELALIKEIKREKINQFIREHAEIGEISFAIVKD